MELDPSRRLSIDLITADLDSAEELTALLAAHVLEPARLLYSMFRPRHDETDHVTFGNLVDIGEGHIVLMKLEEPIEARVARFDPFLRGFVLLCRLFPQVIEPEGFEHTLFIPASAYFERSRSIAHLLWGDLACLVGGLLRRDGLPRPVNRGMKGDYEPEPNDAALSELRAIQALLRSATAVPDDEGRCYSRLDIGLRPMNADGARELDAILRTGARQRLVWFGDAELGYEKAPDGDYREAQVWVDRGVFPTVIPETISAVFALDFVETLRLDRQTGLCAHCGRPLLLTPQQVARVEHRQPVYHADCHEAHRRRYIRDFQRGRTRERNAERA